MTDRAADLRAPEEIRTPSSDFFETLDTFFITALETAVVKVLRELARLTGSNELVARPRGAGNNRRV